VDVIEAETMDQSLAARAGLPLLRGLLRLVGRLSPKGSVEQTEQMLVEAGRPGRLTALDFYGLRMLSILLFPILYYLLLGIRQPPQEGIRNAAIVAAVGMILPWLWLRSRVRRRKHAILRALPDALDMLTIGVEAGLAFESALLRVGQQWDNPLTREFARAVAEMRVGTARDEALERMARRCGVMELSTFVAVLVQSSQLGVSIAHVLHTQAAEMRIKRRQRAEELARQAGVKMVFPLVLLIFPALMVVILGPSVPVLGAFFRSLGGMVGGP
jgi:tight adherence protein C